ncbi:hypothetical protein RIF29_15917 [Crotalaria pallida]|uniref:Uncharacterized protein n=1 Tax=Crotalaria pallida TaxID=3830 RepID=A0AAN9FMR1_CROPI
MVLRWLLKAAGAARVGSVRRGARVGAVRRGSVRCGPDSISVLLLFHRNLLAPSLFPSLSSSLPFTVTFSISISPHTLVLLISDICWLWLIGYGYY